MLMIIASERKAQLLALGFVVGSLVIVAGFIFAVKFLRPESYFAPNPTIDTHFAAGYSEVAFDKVHAGMSKSAVETLLGAPLAIDTTTNRGDRWSYSKDNAGFWDFAWVTREVYFDKDGNVEQTRKDIQYD